MVNMTQIFVCYQTWFEMTMCFSQLPPKCKNNRKDRKIRHHNLSYVFAIFYEFFIFFFTCDVYRPAEYLCNT